MNNPTPAGNPSPGKPSPGKPSPGKPSPGKASPGKLSPGQASYGKRAPGAGRKRLPLPVVLGLMLVAGLCALLALNTASAAQEITQRHLSDSNGAASDTEQQLLRDLAAKQAPGSLASAASALGLVANPNPAFLRINPDGSVTILGSPTPASKPPVPTPTATPKPSASATTTSSRGTSARPTKTAVVTVTVTQTAAQLLATGHVTAPATGTHPSATPRPTPTPTGRN